MTDRKMTALDLLQAAGGKPMRQKASKLRSLAVTRQFEDVLTKAASSQAGANETTGLEAQQKSLGPVKAKAVRMAFTPFGQQALAEAAEPQPVPVKQAALLPESEQPAAEAQTDAGEESPEVPEPEKQEPPRSDAALARLTLLFGGTPPGQRAGDQESGGMETAPASAASRSLAEPAESQPKSSPLSADQAEAEWPLPQADAKSEAVPGRSESLALRNPASASAAEASQTAQAQKPVQVTVTRVETALVPAGLAGGQLMQVTTTAREVQSATPAAPTPPAMPAAPTVVRTMEFRLQPEELGDVRISLHLQGEALRLSVEVVTTEAHALLQRDKRALQDVLEKAGFEIADTAVTITLRPEPMTAQQTPSQGQDAASGQQRGSHGSGSYQPPSGDQSRQDARQSFQEEAHDKSGFTKPQEKARPAAAGGIYL